MLYNYSVTIFDSLNGNTSFVFLSIRQVHKTIQVQTGSLQRVLQSRYTWRKGANIFVDVSYYPQQATHRDMLIKLRLIYHNHKNELPPVKLRMKKLFHWKNNEMTINQQLQLILEKLNKQEKTNKSIISRLDRLENPTFKEAILKGINGQ